MMFSHCWKLKRLFASAIIGALHVTPSAWADDQPTVAATQLAGLFMQSCIPYAGNRAGLREWAHRNGLADLPEPARTAFLNGAPGSVFDASNANGKFVLISDDAGGCSVVAEAANGSAVLAALEDDMRRANIGFTPVQDAPDPQEPRLQHREYRASLGTRTWRIVAGTVRDQQGGRAMLTANPN
jgi:hypothetical protein